MCFREEKPIQARTVNLVGQKKPPQQNDVRWVTTVGIQPTTQYQLADMEFDSGPWITLKCVLMFVFASLQRHLTPVAQNNL